MSDSTIYEGFINEQTTPLAFNLIRNFNELTAEFNSGKENGTAEAIVLLQSQNQAMLRAFAKLEQSVNIKAGEVFTAE